MGQVSEFPMPKRTAETILRDVAQNTDRLINLLHYGDREEFYRLISYRQIIQCLESGEIIRGPSRNEHDHWEVTMYRFCSGVDVYVTAAIENPESTNEPKVYIRKIMNRVE